MWAKSGNSKNSWYWCWCKKWLCSVTLQVAERKDGHSQILRLPITEVVLLVKNKFDLTTDGFITKLKRWDSFWGEPDEVMAYETSVSVLSDLFCMIKLYCDITTFMV